MTTKNLAFYLRKAQREAWAMGQFNFSSAEQLQGIVNAAVKLRSPLLLGTSEGDSAFVGLEQAVAMVRAYRNTTKLPIFLNFDHGHSFYAIARAVKAGYDAIHFDGGKFPLKENISIAKRVVRLAKKNGIAIVEGEFGEIPGNHSELHKEASIHLSKSIYTNPEAAADFIQQTGVDSLAILIGTVHGIYQKRNPRLDLELLQKIRKQVKSFIVLHGGSGTPAQDLSRAIKLGVVKVNISTELRAAFTETLRTELNAKPNEVTPYHIFPPVVQAVQKKTEEKIRFFGSVGKL